MPLFHPPAARVGRRRGAALGLLLGALAVPSALAAQTCIDCPGDPSPPPPGAAHILDLSPHNDVNRALSIFDAAVSYSMPAYVSLDTERSATLFYSSAQARPLATVQVDVTDLSGTLPERIGISLKHANGAWVGLTSGTTELYYLPQAGVNRLAAQFDASGLATGAHTYTLVITSYWNGGSTHTQTTTPVRVLVLNEKDSPFGWGWSLAGLQRLHFQGNGAIVLTEGDGSILYFGPRPCTGCAYVRPPGDFTTLTVDGSNYRRTYPDGTIAVFASTGRLSYVQERYGSLTRTSYAYDTAGRLSSITDPAGKQITFTYDASGKLSSIRDPGAPQRSTTITVNASGDLSFIKDPGGLNALNATYDSSHRMLRRTDRRGGQWGFAYDAAGKLAADTLPTVTVTGDNGQSGSTRPLVRYRSWEAALLPAPGGGTWSNPVPARAPSSLRAEVTNPRWQTTRLVLDRFGAPTRIEEPLGRTTVLVRDPNSQVTRSIEPSGDTTTYTWSGVQGREFQLLRVRNHTSGRQVDFTYENSYNRPLTVQGHTVYRRYFYTGVQLDSMRVGADSARYTTKFTHDARGRVLSASDSAGVKTLYHYSGSGWMNTDSVRVGLNTFRRTAYRYDSGYGRVVSVKNPANDSTLTSYDLLNRTTRTIGAMQDTTTYGYDALYLTSVTDARGQIYRFTPNALGWVTAETDPRGRAIRYTYDLNGNVRSQTNRRSQVVSFTYDALDRPLTRVQHTEGVTTGWEYEPQDRWVRITHPSSTDEFRFDPAGRLTHQIARGVVLESSYDARDLRTELRMTAPFPRSIYYGYNHRMQLDLLNASGGSTRIHYSAAGQPTRVVLPTGLEITYQYSSVRRAMEVSYSNGALRSELGSAYAHDSRGFIRDHFNAAYDQVRAYTYDRLGRLTRHRDETIDDVTCSSGARMDPDGGACNPRGNRSLLADRSYSYDKVGNRTDPQANARYESGSNRLLEFAGFAYEYDEDGNLTRRYRLDGSSDQQLSWNSLGQLSQVWTRNASGLQWNVYFQYDGLGRRIRKELSRDLGNGTLWRYFYDGDDILLEVDFWGNTYEYAYYPGVDRPHSVRQYYSNAHVYYYTTDELGSVTGLINASNQVVNRYRYTPWGEQESFVEGVRNPFTYTGREWDRETGLYYYRNRYYDRLTGRFLSEDPLGLAGGINPYAYAQNNPVNFTDPFGLAPCDPATSRLEGSVETGYIFTCGQGGGGGSNAGAYVFTPGKPGRGPSGYAPSGGGGGRGGRSGRPGLSIPSPSVEFRDGAFCWSDGVCIGVGFAGTVGMLPHHARLAALLYPKKVGRFEWHHIRPQYLGGAANGRQVLLPAEYHQLITNEFRRLAPYGTSAHNVRSIMQHVYQTYPINRFPYFR